MEKKRNYIRFFSQLKAQYAIKERMGQLEECTIMNVSRKGMGIKFHTDNTISPGSTIHVEIPVPSKSERMKVTGLLKWTGKEGNYIIGGIELTKELDEEMLAKLETVD